MKTAIKVSILVIILGYPFGKLKWAEIQVEELCSEIHTGDSIEIITAKSKDMALNIKSRSAKIIIWEGFAFGRYFCDIELENGKATKKKFFFLD